MFLGQGVLWKEAWGAIHDVQDQIRKTPGTSCQERSKDWSGNLQDCTTKFKEALSKSPTAHQSFDQLSDGPRAGQKRQRKSNDEPSSSPSSQQSQQTSQASDEDTGLPPEAVMDELVQLYFENFQPWIPVLHMARFRARMANAEERKSLGTIFLAITSVCVRFSQNPYFERHSVRAKYAKRSRQKVILDSMESFSVENLQALVIIALDTVRSHSFYRKEKILILLSRLVVVEGPRRGP
jgi:hypothetical protein